MKSIPKLQRCHRWILGMDKWFHATLYNGCNDLFMVRWKLIHVCEMGPRSSITSAKQSIILYIFDGIYSITIYFIRAIWIVPAVHMTSAMMEPRLKPYLKDWITLRRYVSMACSVRHSLLLNSFGWRYFLSKANIWNVNCAGNSIHFRHTNGCPCGSVKVFETENVSTWGGLEPPAFGLMPNALTYWAIRARHFLSHVFEYWLWWWRYFWRVKLTFEMLTVRGQQHSFATHELVFLWKCQKFWDRKCLDLMGTRTPNLRIHDGLSVTPTYALLSSVITRTLQTWTNINPSMHM